MESLLARCGAAGGDWNNCRLLELVSRGLSAWQVLRAQDAAELSVRKRKET